MTKKKTGSIDDITPEEWNEMARKDREERAKSKLTYGDPEPLTDILTEEPLIDFNPRIEYRYNEGSLIEELRAYVDSTYGQHYSQNKFQATEFIIDGGHGEGFCIGNIMKYAQRYGNKDGYNRKDIMKVLHYALIMLYVHDHEGREW